MHSHWRDCKAWRDEHLPLSTTSDEACKLYDATLTQYTGWYDDASVGGIEASIKGMITSDPNFAMGHVLGVGLELMGTGHSPRLDPVFKAEIDQLGTLASSTNLTQREQLHVKAIQLLGEGMMTEACDAWEKILLQHPTDMLAIKFCQDAYFYLGYQPQMRDSVARVLPSWKSSQPLYGYLMGMHAFGLCETNMYSQAEKSARKCLEINARDAWGTHALAHVLEMQGRYNEGITFMSTTVSDWSTCGILACHNFWHWALYHIEKGEYQGAIDIYDGEVSRRAYQSGAMLDVVDACSMLYRLEMEGMKVEGRWNDLYDTCAPHQKDHLLAFNDSHLLMAFLGSNNKDMANECVQSLKHYVRDGKGTNQKISSEVGLTLCEALLAYDQGEYDEAFERLYPLRYDLVTIGGSNAQGLEMNPRDTWSTHALAHILEMEGRYNEGITFLSSTVNNWSESGGLTFHNLWHWAVYHIEKGQYQAALDIFDGELAPATKKGSMITLVDTTSLLYRLEMEGENVGERWQGLYEVCRKHQSDHLQPFYDSHMLLAYLGAEHTETATNMLESMKQLVREQPGTRYGSTHEVSISLCEALVAYDQGEFNKAVKLLYPQRYKIVTLGGSTAQRDIFNQFLIHAALKSNNTENIKLARHLLAERKALKTDAPLTDRLITQCIAIHID